MGIKPRPCRQMATTLTIKATTEFLLQTAVVDLGELEAGLCSG